MSNLRQEFIEFSVKAGVIRFGDFVTKAGRNSPYFSMRVCLTMALI